MMDALDNKWTHTLSTKTDQKIKSKKYEKKVKRQNQEKNENSRIETKKSAFRKGKHYKKQTKDSAIQYGCPVLICKITSTDRHCNPLFTFIFC